VAWTPSPELHEITIGNWYERRTKLHQSTIVGQSVFVPFSLAAAKVFKFDPLKIGQIRAIMSMDYGTFHCS